MQRAMQACLAIDLTRLITRLRHASPTGIDRVDLAYARHILSQGTEGTRFGLVSTAFGPRVLDRETARGIVEAVAAGTAPTPSFADGLHVQEVLDAVARSSESEGVWTGVDADLAAAPAADRAFAAS